MGSGAWRILKNRAVRRRGDIEVLAASGCLHPQPAKARAATAFSIVG
jgi:hypothetical protein